MTTKKIDNKIRGGRGSVGDPAEIRASMAEAHKKEAHIDHDLAKLKNDKEGLLFTIADLQIKEKQVMDGGHVGDAKAFRREINKAQERIDAINGILPERGLSEDSKKIQKIITEWHDGKRDWTKELAQYAKAEKTLRTNPSDGHTIGDAIRARTEKVATEELLSKAAHEAELLMEDKKPNPAREEGVFHTNEQTIAERKEWEERHNVPHKEAAEEIAPERMEPAQPKEEATEQELLSLKNEGMESAQQEAPTENPEATVAEITNTEVAPILESYDALLPIVPVAVTEIIVTPKVEEESAFVKFKDLSEEREKETPSEEEPAKNLEDNILSTENKAEGVSSSEARVDAEAFEKIISTEEILNAPTITPVEELTIETHADEIAGPETPVEEERLKDAPSNEYFIPETTNNPQAIAHAEKQVRSIIKQVWGKKGGWFGVGSTDGLEIFKDFAEKTVDEVKQSKVAGVNKEVQGLIKQARDQTHVKPALNEKVWDYLIRSAAVAIDKFLKNG